MIRIHLTVAIEIAQLLGVESRKRGITIQALIRNIIGQYYETKKAN